VHPHAVYNSNIEADNLVQQPGKTIIMPEIRPREPKLIALVFIVAGLGTLGLAISTVWGPGLREDSFSYITAADSFARGTGLGRWAADGTFRPLTHFPPLLPLILAMFRFAGGDPVVIARILNLTLFFLTIVVAAWCIHTLTESNIPAFVGALLLATSPVLLEQYSWAQSEPLFLSLCLAGIGVFAYYLKSKHRFLLLGASVLAGMGFLARFAGIAFIFSSAFVCIYFPWAPLKRRFAAFCTYLGVSLFPTGLFLISNQIRYGNLLDRPIPTWHPPSVSTWLQAAETISTWVIPSRILHTLSALPVLLSLAMLSVLILDLLGLFIPVTQAQISRSNTPGFWLYRLIAANLFGYSILILITVLFLDRLTPLNDRILSPLYLFGLIFAVGRTATWLGRIPSLHRKAVFMSVLLLLAGSISIRGVIRIRTLNHQGLGLSTPGWHHSETIAALASFVNVPVYTNDIPAIYFYTGQMAAFIPVRENPAEGEVRGDYEGSLARMHREMRRSNGILVLFGSDIRNRLHSSNLEDLTKGLTSYGIYEDGEIYQTNTAD
jgi:hypothetical protein